METLKIVGGVIGGLVGLGCSIFGLYFYFKKCFKSALKVELAPIQTDLDTIHKELKEINKADCKNFLVKYLNDKEENIPQNSACEKRAYEVKDRAKELGVNSYIASKWKKIMGEDW